MFALLLLALLALWIFADYGREAWARRHDDERRAKKATLRRTLLAREPESPAAFERLGDAMREADDPTEAIACYEEALTLRARLPGDTAGGGLENKLRFARLDRDERDNPAQFGQTYATRQQVCRTCGGLSLPQAITCQHCGTPLAVDGFWETLRRRGLREEIVREMSGMLGKFAVVVIAVIAGSWMPWEVRGTLLIAAVIVLPFQFLKRIGPD